VSLDADIALLREVATFDILDAEALRILAISAEVRTLAPGEALFRAGETADCAYVLVSGIVNLVTEVPGGEPKVLHKVKPGTLLGETALVAATPRPATALAAEAASVMRISRSTFLRMLEGYPQAAKKLRRAFAKRLESTMRALDRVRASLEEVPPVPRRR